MKALSLLTGIDLMEEKEEELAKKELEDNAWVDPTPDLVEGIFYVDQTNICQRCCSKKRSKKKPKIVVYDYRSLYFWHFNNACRRELVNFTCSNMFENLVILLILINSVLLAIYDYKDRDNLTDWN